MTNKQASETSRAMKWLRRLETRCRSWMLGVTSVRRAPEGGWWMKGILKGHAYEALLLVPGAVERGEILGQSNISELWVRQEDGATVCGYARKWVIRPERHSTAARVVERLGASLADLLCDLFTERRESFCMSKDELGIRALSSRDAGGVWVAGFVYRHHYLALVFPEHPGPPHHAYRGSRITKLWIRRAADRKTIAHFERGWAVRPVCDDAANLVYMLAANLADAVFARDDLILNKQPNLAMFR